MKFPILKSMRYFSLLKCFFFLMISEALNAQVKIDLTSLNSFKNPTANWHIVGNVIVDIKKSNTFTYSEGNGILMNFPNATMNNDLVTTQKFGDVDIEFDCMMAKETSSAIYLQGRYKINLIDSWGIAIPNSTDMGGIAKRIDGKKSKDQPNFDGKEPRQNVAKAAGLWQHLKICFLAPRFVNGVKKENAKIIRMELNGILIQKDIELSGTTEGSISKTEVPEDALRFQGGQGMIAYRNIIISDYRNPKPTLTNLNLQMYRGQFEKEPDISTLGLYKKLSNTAIAFNLKEIPKNKYLMNFKGLFTVPVAGTYNFNTKVTGGPMKLTINNKVVYPYAEDGGKVSVDLPKGTFQFSLLYAKYEDYKKVSLIMKVSGPGFREFALTDSVSNTLNFYYPVLLNANKNMIVRSYNFIDLPNNVKVTHAVNVGSAAQLHYNYDVNMGSLVQIWHGEFLDVAPSWRGRGDADTKPLGTVLYLGKPTLSINRLKNSNVSWSSDTTSTGFKPKGYVLDEKDRPAFKYNIYGASVTDRTVLLDNNQGLQRTISIKNNPGNLYFLLATNNLIEAISPGFYLIGDHEYFLQLNNPNIDKPIIRVQNGTKELMLPVTEGFTYSIYY